MPKDKLLKLMRSVNISEDLDEDKLNEISHKVLMGTQEDISSRHEWLQAAQEAIDLAKLKSKPKDWPRKNSANIMFPLISTAALQFNARTYPEIIRNGKVVLAEVIGKDPQGVKTARARRVSTFMSYQLLCQSNDWEKGTDSLLLSLPVVGTMFRKTFFSPTKQKISSEVCLPDEIIINNGAKSLEQAHRVTHRFVMSQNDIVSKIRAGVFCDVDIDSLQSGIEYKKDTLPEHMIQEQHRWLDLDEDGYEEPYVVTIHEASGKILRIVARYNPSDITYTEDDKVICIDPIQYFTDYHFIPSPDGSFYSMGFGTLLLPMNKTMNSLLNLLMDSGTLASLQGGFIGSGAKLKSGNMEFNGGEWKVVDSFGMDLKQNILPLDYKEPSPVLFQLLQFLVEHTNKLTSITDALSGNERTQNSPATSMLAMVEQGLKVFTAIMRRQYWSFKKEFEKIYRLNRLFLSPEEYQNVLDEPIEIGMDEQGNPTIPDFEEGSYDVKPVSDPNIASDTQRTARMQLLMQLSGDPQFGGMLNPKEILMRVLTQADIPNVENLIQEPSPPPPDPKMMQVQIDGTVKESEMRVKEMQLEMEQASLQKELEMKDAQIELTKAQATLALAQSEVAVGKKELDLLRLELDSLKESNKAEMHDKQLEHDAKMNGVEAPEPTEVDNEQTEPASMAGAPSDEGALEPPAEQNAAQPTQPPAGNSFEA